MKTVRGFAILSAIFILVVLAALGAFILTISSGQQIGSALDVQGARAYQAARAGIEWGLYRQLRDGVCPAGPTGFTPAGTTFSGLTVTVTCTAHAATHGGPTVHEVVSTACNQAPCPNPAPGNLYVERRLTVTF